MIKAALTIASILGLIMGCRSTSSEPLEEIEGDFTMFQVGNTWEMIGKHSYNGLLIGRGEDSIIRQLRLVDSSGFGDTIRYDFEIRDSTFSRKQEKYDTTSGAYLLVEVPLYADTARRSEARVFVTATAIEGDLFKSASGSFGAYQGEFQIPIPIPSDSLHTMVLNGKKSAAYSNESGGFPESFHFVKGCGLFDFDAPNHAPHSSFRDVFELVKFNGEKITVIGLEELIDP